MTRKRRTILFLTCFFLLFLTAPVVTLYSLGYRFDFDPPTGGVKIVQTGGFYCRVLPKNAEIYLNGELANKTDFLFRSAFIKNLLPKTYAIEIKKEGYYPWTKSLEIKEQQVTEAKDVILIPRDPNFALLDKKVRKFWLSPDGKKIILLKEEFTLPDFGGEAGWVLELLEPEKNSQIRLLDEKEISSFIAHTTSTDLFPLFSEKENQNVEVSGVELLAAEFSQDSKKLLLKTSYRPSQAEKNPLKQKTIYFVLELDNPITIFSLDFLGDGAEKLSFDSQNPQTLFFTKPATTASSLFRADYKKKEVSKPILEGLVTYKNYDSDIIWLSGQGFLHRSNSAGETSEILNLKPVDLNPETNYEINGTPSKILLRENSSLYFLDNSRKFEKVSEPVKNAGFSPDFRKIAYFSDYEIWIFFVEEQYSQPQKQAGEKVFLTRFSEKINNCFWLSNYYLIFNAGDKIKIAEIDDRNKINTYDFAEFKEPEIFFKNKKLYISSDGNLYSAKIY